MKINMDRSLLLFLFSPWFCLATIFQDIYHRKSVGFVLLAAIFGVLSYLYVPSNSADKSYYFNLHQYFSEISFAQGMDYIRTRMTDMVFYILILISAQVGLSLSVLSGLVTFFTILIIFFIYQSAIESQPISRLMALLGLLTLIGTLSLPTLFSGIRFYLGVSFALLGIYLVLLSGRGVAGALVLFAATLSHFSMIGIAVIVMTYAVVGRPHRLLSVLYLSSFYFVFGGELNVLLLIPLIDLDPLYLEKALSYMHEKEFVISNRGHEIYLFFKGLWFYLVSWYALINLNNRDNPWYSALLLILILCNGTYAFPYIFSRFAMLATLIFVFSVVLDISRTRRNLLFGAFFFSICVCTTALDIWVQRDSFAVSFVRAEAVSWPTLIVFDPVDGVTFDKGTL